jgi:hypothetical protein
MMMMIIIIIITTTTTTMMMMMMMMIKQMFELKLYIYFLPQVSLLITDGCAI